MYWKQVFDGDSRAKTLADRHYSRQNAKSKLFCPPGNKFVLLGARNDALWVSSRQIYRKDGFDCWTNPYFRNESIKTASDLIIDALQATLWWWSDYDIPYDGFHSFVDPNRVRGVKVHGKIIYGWCFYKAGFSMSEKSTKDRGLIRWVFSAEQLHALVPKTPQFEQRSLF